MIALTGRQGNPCRRITTPGASDTKEGRSKRVPIHKDPVPILNAVMEGPSLLSGRFLALRDYGGVPYIGPEFFKIGRPRAGKKLKLETPRPPFQDLRHAWESQFF